jgi:hypothetical protein
MKFGQREIPDMLFDMARERMRRDDTFTPDDVRQHLASDGEEYMLFISDIPSNWPIIADRVTRACINELRDAGEIEQVKKGVWTRVEI